MLTLLKSITIFSQKNKNKNSQNKAENPFFRTWSFVLWNNFFRVRARTLSANHATTEAADWGQPIERPIIGVAALYDARQAS
jgi:hypothetical protein